MGAKMNNDADGDAGMEFQKATNDDEEMRHGRLTLMPIGTQPFNAF